MTAASSASAAAAGAAAGAALAANIAAGYPQFKSNAEAAKASLPYMTVPGVDLADQDPEDSEEVVIAWMTPLLRTSNSRRAGDVLPFCVVNQVAGTENIEEGTAAPIVSVHWLTAKMLGRNNLKAQAKAGHKRMIRLGIHCDTITLTDGRKVGVDYVDVVEQPINVDYQDDLIIRKVGRYEIGLTYN
jgi:hypothetical protein